MVSPKEYKLILKLNKLNGMFVQNTVNDVNKKRRLRNLRFYFRNMCWLDHLIVGILNSLLLSQILVSCQRRVMFSACVVQRPFQDRQARMLPD